MQFRKSTAVGVALTLGGNFILNLASPDPVGSNCAWAKGVVSGKNTAAEKVSADATGEVPADGARLVPDRSHANLKVRRRAGKEPSHKSEEPPLVEKYLLEGRLAEGETALLTRLRKQGDDDQARFGLGVLQFLRAVEGLGQDFYRFGLRDYSSHGFVLPFLRLPVPANSEPQLMTYRDAREIAERLNSRLAKAEGTLAAVESAEVSLPLHFGLIRLNLGKTGDLTSENLPGDENLLWKIYARLTRNSSIADEKARAFYIKFDRGDVHWLRGYCHVLMTACDFYLAHDSRETFERTGHLFFSKVDSPAARLGRSKKLRGFGPSNVEVLDLLALVHLINWKVAAPEKMASALEHMEAVIDQSRVSWKWIMAEIDDDHEWLPNPRQTGVIPNVRVSDSMVRAWAEIMDESEMILAGKKLIPFWRALDNDSAGYERFETASDIAAGYGTGINVRKVFLEPQPFDLVLWVQGSAAIPYLEKGPLTHGDTWRRLTGEFGSQFPGFAFWFN